MQTKSFLVTVIALLIFLCGCAGKHIIGYDIIKPALSPQGMGQIHIATFADERPLSERKGGKGKLMTFSSKDAHFAQEVPRAIETILTEELNNVGFSIVAQAQPHNYQIYGTLKHFQAILSARKITHLPYLGTLVSLWAKDEFTILLSIYIKMTDRREKVLIDRTFDVSSDLRLPTGLINLARYSRGFDYKLRLLDEALKDVMGQIRDEVVAKAK